MSTGHPLYAIILQDLKTDITQMKEQGHDYNSLVREVEQAESQGSADALLKLQQELWNRPSPSDFPYNEPNEWEEISSTFCSINFLTSRSFISIS